MVEAYGIGGVLLLALNVWALVNILQSRAATGGKVLWTLLILLLPFLGFLVWLIGGPRGRRVGS